jgi:hypothetical protein
MSEHDTGWRWKRSYETGNGLKHWSLVTDQSQETGRVACAAIVLRLNKDDWFGQPFQQEPVPRRIVACLRACEGLSTELLEEQVAKGLRIIPAVGT